MLTREESIQVMHKWFDELKSGICHQDEELLDALTNGECDLLFAKYVCVNKSQRGVITVSLGVVTEELLWDEKLIYSGDDLSVANQIRDNLLIAFENCTMFTYDEDGCFII